MKDPWATTQQTVVGGNLVAETLTQRARKRLADIKRTGARTWRVTGNKSLGDTYPHYDVRYDGTYHCDCYDTDHGEHRARRMCSHVVAVLIWRAEVGGWNGKEVDPPATGESVTSQPIQGKLGTEAQSPTAGNQEDRAFEFVPAATLPSPDDSKWIEWETELLPNKFQSIHNHQSDAVLEVVETYSRGIEVVYLDAPTGSGKTLIAELVRRMMRTRAFYICHSKTLQDQFVADFQYARVLKGRSNYPTLDMPYPEVSAADCTGNPCQWCPDIPSCPYQIAKADAHRSKLAVLNTAYFLNESNYVGELAKLRDLGIIDECDTLESELMGFVEFYVGERLLGKLGLDAPKDGSHKTTIARWIVDELKPKLYKYRQGIFGNDIQAIRERLRADRLLSDVLRISKVAGSDTPLEGWVRDNRAGPLVLKPIRVDEWGDNYVWRHALRWLCMSATIISAQVEAQSLGLEGGDGMAAGGRRWELITVPMTFPVENRKIVVAPVADMSRKGKESGQWEVCAEAIRRVVGQHPGENVLVHTVSYDLARLVVRHLRNKVDSKRRVLTYADSRERDTVLSQFRRSTGAILVAPSMDRGVDLAGEDCRVVIVAKVPFPNLGDRQVNERLHSPGGQGWYTVQTVRSIVQMTGRAVRNKEDWAISYVLDRQFTKNLWAKNKLMLPKWWRDAVDMTVDVRSLVA